MSEKNELDAASAESPPQWADLWQSFSESSKQIAEVWSSSMAPFMLARLLEHPGGFAMGNEMSKNGVGFRRMDRNAPKAGKL
jgi:hypothetical protein